MNLAFTDLRPPESRLPRLHCAMPKAVDLGDDRWSDKHFKDVEDDDADNTGPAKEGEKDESKMFGPGGFQQMMKDACAIKTSQLKDVRPEWERAPDFMHHTSGKNGTWQGMVDARALGASACAPTPLSFGVVVCPQTIVCPWGRGEGRESQYAGCGSVPSNDSVLGCGVFGVLGVF